MNKKRNCIVLVVLSSFVFALVLIVTGIAPMAAETAVVGVTVTAQNIAVYVKDTTVAYGNMPLSTSKCSTTTSDTQEAINSGNITADFNIKTTDSTDWDLSTSSIGTDVYVHRFSTTTGDYDWPAIDNEYITLEEGIAAGATSTVDFYMFVPSGSSSYDAQSANITIQAVDGT